MRRLLASLFLWIGFLPLTIANPTPTAFDIFTEDYPPYNFIDENQKLMGFSVDLLETVLKEVQIAKNRKDFVIVPWARGYADTQDPKQKNMLFSMTRTEAREKLFKWVGPITETTIVVFAPKTKLVTIQKVEDLQKYQFGVIRGDIGELLLQQQSVPQTNIQPSSKFDAILKKMALNRIELLAYEKNAAFWLMKKYGFNPEDYQSVYTLQKSHLYYAFNLSIDDATITMLQKALEKVKLSEQHQHIQEKYLH